MNRSEAAVYVHFPWCLHRCNYCDFTTTANHNPPTQRYTEAIVDELRLRAEHWRPKVVSSVFFGGGTPSLWGPRGISAVLKAIDNWAPIAQNAEISMEANPSSAVGLRDFALAGVNRISLGVQATDDRRLKALDRIHDAETAHKALRQISDLLACGALQSANADLMFGSPDQGVAELKQDVETLMSYGLPHLSAYALTVEQGTPLAKRVERGLTDAPNETVQATMLEMLPELVRPFGLKRYEVSNFARPEHACKHNLAYWRGKYYLALGVGAHGFVPASEQIGRRYGNHNHSTLWMEAIESGRLLEAFEEHPSTIEHRDELLLTSLRLAEGLQLDPLRQRLGTSIASSIRDTASRLAANGAPYGGDGASVWIAQSHWGHLDRHVFDLVHELDRNFRSLH